MKNGVEIVKIREFIRDGTGNNEIIIKFTCIVHLYCFTIVIKFIDNLVLFKQFYCDKVLVFFEFFY